MYWNHFFIGGSYLVVLRASVLRNHSLVVLWGLYEMTEIKPRSGAFKSGSALQTVLMLQFPKLSAPRASPGLC